MTFQEFFVDFERENGERVWLSTVTENVDTLYKTFNNKGNLEKEVESLYYERVCSEAEYFYKLSKEG